MNQVLRRVGLAILIAVAEIILLKYAKFSLWAIVLLGLFFGWLVKVLEHRNFGWALIVGTILFTAFMLIFGWTIMQEEGWVKPQ
ncbi:MAG: hypothetical protein HC817_00870, partial [Saprospiraceae bacterium]|nr:hypothetical protein [Saprospiraceae bacterium]